MLDVRDDDISYDPLFPLPTSLRTLPNREDNAERNAMLTTFPLAESFDVGSRFVIRQREDLTRRIVVDDRGSVVIENVTIVSSR